MKSGNILSLRTKTARQSESTPRVTKQLQHLGNLKNCIYITDLPKVQSEPCVTNIDDLSSHPEQRRQLLLRKGDKKVKIFLLTLRLKKGMVNTVVTVVVAKALIAKSSDGSLRVLDLDNSSWTKSLFVRMGFLKRPCTTTDQNFLKVLILKKQN